MADSPITEERLAREKQKKNYSIKVAWGLTK
jgi:hypothetical protein